MIQNLWLRLAKLPDWLKLTALAAGLRLPTLGLEKFWWDETYTAWQARPTTDLGAAILGDVHPPLWPLLQALNERLFGASEFTFRLPAALFGIGAVLLIWQIALALKFQPRTAFLAGVLAAILPGAIYYSQDARMYGALSFFVLLALLGAVRHNWVLVFVGGAGAAYSHNVGLLYDCALALSLLLPGLRGSRRGLLAPLLTLAGVAAAWLPWGALALPAQLALVKSDYWVPPLSVAGIVFPYLETTLTWRLAHALQIPSFFAVLMATGIGLIVARRWITRQGLPVLAVAFGAPGLLVLASLFWTSIYVYRVIVPASMALCLLWAYLLNHLSAPNRAVARAVMVPVLACALVSYYVVNRRQDLRAWVQPILDQYQPGDLIYHADLMTMVNYGWYLQGLPQMSAPSLKNAMTVTDQARLAMHIQEYPLEQADPRVYHRFWLLISTSPYMPQSEINAIQRLKATYPLRLVAASEKGSWQSDYIYIGALQ